MPSITTSDGVRLDYTETGDPHGRPVLLLAGFLAAGTAWLYQQRTLARAGYRVLTLDARGHGTSQTAPSGHTMARRGEDLHDVLTALDLRGVTLVGQSMGGNSVWAYLDAHPSERLAGIVIVDQTPKMLTTPDWPYGFYGYTEDTRDTLFATGVPDTGHGTPVAKRGMRLVRLARAMKLFSGGAKRAPLTPAELELLHDHAVQDWREVIADVGAPTLFVAGRESEFWPCEHADAAASLTPRASATVLENAGHATNIEQPAAFDRVLLAFLTTNG